MSKRCLKIFAGGSKNVWGANPQPQALETFQFFWLFQAQPERQLALSSPSWKVPTFLPNVYADGFFHTRQSLNKPNHQRNENFAHTDCNIIYMLFAKHWKNLSYCFSLPQTPEKMIIPFFQRKKCRQAFFSRWLLVGGPFPMRKSHATPAPPDASARAVRGCRTASAWPRRPRSAPRQRRSSWAPPLTRRGVFPVEKRGVACVMSSFLGGGWWWYGGGDVLFHSWNWLFLCGEISANMVSQRPNLLVFDSMKTTYVWKADLSFSLTTQGVKGRLTQTRRRKVMTMMMMMMMMMSPDI